MGAASKIKVKIDPDLQEIVPGYIEKRKNEIIILNNALLAMDFATLQTMGHKIKGSGGGYGFTQLGSYGAELEKAAKEKNVGKVTEIIKNIEQYLENLEVEF
jgi:HPt (histidine-containing phosphotransfer) domain-containing protein